MKYKITIKNKDLKVTEEVEGIKALHNALAHYRAEGWQIVGITRPKRRLVLQSLKALVLQ